MDELFPQESGDQCRVCNETTVDGRWNYCSERCREIAHAVHEMFQWDAVREAILERDGYTCQQCGLSKERWWRAYHQVQDRIKERVPHPRRSDEDISWDEWRSRQTVLRERYGVESPAHGGFHVDHIERIADGGHPLDEDNLWTLCKYCHREKTADENSAPDTRPESELTLTDYLDQ